MQTFLSKKTLPGRVVVSLWHWHAVFSPERQKAQGAQAQLLEGDMPAGRPVKKIKSGGHRPPVPFALLFLYKSAERALRKTNTYGSQPSDFQKNGANVRRLPGNAPLRRKIVSVFYLKKAVWVLRAAQTPHFGGKFCV
jgi:hypothetical protein